MKYFVIIFTLSLPLSSASAATCKGTFFKIVLHGGSGAGNKPEEFQKEMKKGAIAALKIGYQLASTGGSAENIVVAVISSLEDSPYFNAGKGAIHNKAGFAELDASIMRGRDRNAGAVAASRSIKNPIKGAQAFMNRSEHLMFVDRGADKFAKALGLETVENSYFKSNVAIENANRHSSLGTVGAVVLDKCGNLAAGTSTGGYSTKVPGRVGDSPIIGAGTFADNESCAVSATGQGEIFIRWSAAYDTCALVEYKGWDVTKASEDVIAKVKSAGAQESGLIVLDKEGNHAWPYSSKGMLRGMVEESGNGSVAIIGEPSGFHVEK